MEQTQNIDGAEFQDNNQNDIHQEGLKSNYK
jgi:hypothetical protein